jgi:hypothetical protein
MFSKTRIVYTKNKTLYRVALLVTHPVHGNHLGDFFQSIKKDQGKLSVDY